MLKKSLLLVGTTLLLNASSTMCFKKNHKDPSTIESIALDGGQCAGKKSVSDMNHDGFIVDDIKVTSGDHGLDYIYVFKDQTNVVATNFNNEKIIQKKKKEDKNKEQISLGKKLYISTCLKCHGKKAELSAYNTSRPLNSLTLEDMQISLRDYENDEKDNGMAIIMKPFAAKLDSNDIINVAKYIKTLK